MQKNLHGTQTAHLKPGKEPVRSLSMRKMTIIRRDGQIKISAVCKSPKFHTLQHLNYNCVVSLQEMACFMSWHFLRVSLRLKSLSLTY